MGIKSLSIVPPGCVTTALNNGRGGDGREMWVWLGVGWCTVAGNKRSRFEQAAGRKKQKTEDRWRDVGERQDGYMF